MNEKRRKRLREAVGHLEDALCIVQDVSLEEQLAHDNLPDVFQYGEQGERMEEVVSNLQEAESLIQEATQLVGESV